MLIVGLLAGAFLYDVLMGDRLVNRGRIQVASGLASCALKERDDHSTYWVCADTKSSGPITVREK